MVKLRVDITIKTNGWNLNVTILITQRTSKYIVHCNVVNKSSIENSSSKALVQ